MKKIVFILSMVILLFIVGCKKAEDDSDTVLFYPNSFSPNGDGRNDYWAPQGTSISVDGYSLKIYNQNDKLLFETDDFTKSWNGKVNDVRCPVGYYYFVVKYQTLNGEKYKDSGMLQLIR